MKEEGEIDDDDYEVGRNAKHMIGVSNGTMQLSFMKRTFNQLEREKRKGTKKVEEKTRVFPTVLRPSDASVM